MSQNRIPPALRVRACRSGLLALLLALLVSGALAPLQGQATAHALRTAATVGGCPLFPANNIWNQDISHVPLHPNSARYMASIGLNHHIQGDFGSGLYAGAPIGIPYSIVPGSQPTVPMSFSYASESDPGPYPYPRQTPIEGGPQSTGDRHVIVINSGTCKLYETFASYPQPDGSWKAGSGAVWNLNSNALRPRSWTSADAAGLPIFAGLARYDEVASGAITHALRFTTDQTQQAYIWPARHFASSNTNPNLPPMGLRLRLKASFNVAAYPPQARIVLTALQHYGMILADNGTCCFIGGSPDERWNNNDVIQLKSVLLSNFEAVDESPLQVSPDSAAVNTLAPSLTHPTAKPTSATPTAKPISSPTTHRKVAVSMASVTPTAGMVAEDQKKRALLSHSEDSKNWMNTMLPISAGALLLIGALWWRLRRLQMRKRE
jgi:hypothetical protein